MAPPTPTGQNGNGQEKVGSPVKEHLFLHRETSLNRETSASEVEKEQANKEPQVGTTDA